MELKKKPFFTYLEQKNASQLRYERAIANKNLFYKYLNSTNNTRALIMKNAPWEVTKEQVIDFFKPAAKVGKADIVIEKNFRMKSTGNVLVLFKDEAAAADAKASLDKKNIGK